MSEDLPPPLQGRARRFGDDINTDVIYPGKFLAIYEPTEMAKYLMAGVDPTFAASVQPHDIIVAGKFFGCGSSREQAVLAMSAAGIEVIIAKSFARIFYRNGINSGLWLLQCPTADAIADQAHLSVDFVNAAILEQGSGATHPFVPVPPFLAKIVRAGGLVPHLRAKLAAERGSLPST